jgi:hypothetical protein
MVEEFIYFEKQQSALCGQHCLNALLQGSFFTPGQSIEVVMRYHNVITAALFSF